MTTPRKRVLITGVTGRIGRLIAECLSETYEFSGLARQSSGIPTHLADVTDLEGMLPAFEGIHAVVHLAADPSPTAPWDSVYASNIGGAYNVLEASRQSGVDAVIFASSNHAHGWWEMDHGSAIYTPADTRRLGPDDPYQPDSLYGWSKAAGEALGRYYSDVHGLRVFNLRIGWVMDVDDPLQADIGTQKVPPLDDKAARARACAIWLSHRDCVELIRCCLEADHVRYGVYYGISDNAGKFYDLTNAREELGYHPQDGAPAP
jgi:NAD+ dependent glucose-6-phosphate dehydrogenase